MLIVFDLDDTLIETSLCLTPIYLRFAFDALHEKGLGLSEADFQNLLEMDAELGSGKEAVKKFIEQFPKGEAHLKEVISQLTRPLPPHCKVDCVPHAKELLLKLQLQHTLALVTMGSEDFQRQKMKNAGIQPEAFSKLVVVAEPIKKKAYRDLMTHYQVSPRDTIVCGDHIDRDLKPAKELGCFTIHFRNGRGKKSTGLHKYVDLTIDRLEQIYEVFSHNENETPSHQ